MTTPPAAIDTSIVVALIGAGVSLAVAIVAQVGNRRTSTRVQKLEEERAERSARRDYEYEARKRLYEECEPLLFQAVELAEAARSRVVSLARTARNGKMAVDGSGWLAGPGYYFKSTAYLLFAPATTFRMLQTQLTVVDLGLERRLRTHYELLKLVFQSFNADFDLAERAVPEPLPYEPDKTDPGESDRDKLLASSPQRYARQGVYRGVLDVVVEALIVDDAASERSRCMTFGEFLRDWDRSGSDLHGIRGTLFELLGGFHPARKPVLWRVLLAQYLLYTVLLRDDPLGAPLEPLSDSEIRALDWRREPGEATDDAIRAPARAAEAYVRDKLVDVGKRVTPTGA
jgi:hypothetical protein